MFTSFKMMLLLTTIFLAFAVSYIAPAKLDDVKKLALANNELAFKLHQTFNSQGNVFFSPASIFIALGMVYQGARGKTAEEIRNTLSYDVAGLDDQNLNQIYHDYLSLIVNSSDQYKLEIANTILSQIQYPMSEEYKKILKNYYDAIVKEVDFAKDNAKTVQEINSWVNSKTQGKIPKLLESLDPKTVLVLLNAVYFKGDWKTMFSSTKTRDQIFYNDGINIVSVPMMSEKFQVLYGEEDGFKSLKLPYKGDEISMVLLLPNDRNGLSKVEAALTASKLDSIISKMKGRSVTIDIPKFKLEDSKELTESLIRLGMNSAFSNVANFNGIFEQGKVKVSSVVHKAVIEVNEEGSEAAAVTAIRFFITSSIQPPSYSFRADHPFLFFIRDERTGMILFFGRINKF